MHLPHLLFASSDIPKESVGMPDFQARQDPAPGWLCPSGSLGTAGSGFQGLAQLPAQPGLSWAGFISAFPGALPALIPLHQPRPNTGHHPAPPGTGTSLPAFPWENSTWRLQGISSGALSNTEQGQPHNAWEENPRSRRRSQDSKGWDGLCCIHRYSLSFAKSFRWHREGGRTAFHDTRQQEFIGKQANNQGHAFPISCSSHNISSWKCLGINCQEFHCCFGILSSGK